jgi:hypothetical protein
MSREVFNRIGNKLRNYSWDSYAPTTVDMSWAKLVSSLSKLVQISYQANLERDVWEEEAVIWENIKEIMEDVLDQVESVQNRLPQEVA